MSTSNSATSILLDVVKQNSNASILPGCGQECGSESALLDCVVQAAQKTFRLLCDMELVQPAISNGCAVGRFEMSGVVCISGAKRLTVAINASETFCRDAFRAMTNEENATTEDLHDTLGELANQLVGSAKDMLQIRGLELGLPTIVWGHGHHVAFAHDMQQHVVGFGSVDDLRIEVGIARL